MYWYRLRHRHRPQQIPAKAEIPVPRGYKKHWSSCCTRGLASLATVLSVQQQRADIDPQDYSAPAKPIPSVALVCLLLAGGVFCVTPCSLPQPCSLASQHPPSSPHVQLRALPSLRKSEGQTFQKTGSAFMYSIQNNAMRTEKTQEYDGDLYRVGDLYVNATSSYTLVRIPRPPHRPLPRRNRSSPLPLQRPQKAPTGCQRRHRQLP